MALLLAKQGPWISGMSDVEDGYRAPRLPCALGTPSCPAGLRHCHKNKCFARIVVLRTEIGDQ